MQFLCFALLLFEIRYEHECFPMIIWGARLTKLEETAHLRPTALPFSFYSSHFLFQTALSNISQRIELIAGHKTVNKSDRWWSIIYTEDCLNVLLSEIIGK